MALFLLASASAAATSIILFSLLLSLETSLLSKSSPTVVEVQQDVGQYDPHYFNDGVGGAALHFHENYYYDPPPKNRQLQLSMTEEEVTTNNNNNNNNEEDNIDDNNGVIHGQSTSGPGVIVNVLRRARDKVDEKDVPFILQVPYTNSDVIYNIMTECYGLVGREYWDLKELQRDKEANVVDQFYVSSHDRPKEVSLCSMYRNGACYYYLMCTLFMNNH